MTYSEEKYNALLAVCNSYKNDYDNAFERLKAQQREIDGLRAENARLTEKLKQVLLAVDTVKEMNAMCNIDEQNAEIERLKAENACLLKACEEQFTFDTNEIKNCDYVVNAGVSWDNLAPLYTSSSKEAAIDTARHLTIECVEVVYSPCDNWNVDEVVWSNRR